MGNKIFYFLSFTLITTCFFLEESCIFLSKKNKTIAIIDKKTNQRDSVFYSNGNIIRKVKYQDTVLQQVQEYDIDGLLSKEINYSKNAPFHTVSYYNKSGKIDSTVDYLHHLRYGNFLGYYPDGKLRLYQLNDMSAYIEEKPLNIYMKFDKVSQEPIETIMFPFTPYVFSIDSKTQQVIFRSWMYSEDVKQINGKTYCKIPEEYVDLYITVIDVFNTDISLKVIINDTEYNFDNPKTHTVVIKNAFPKNGDYVIRMSAKSYFLEKNKRTETGGYQFEERFYKG